MLSVDSEQQLESCKAALRGVEEILSHYLSLDDKNDTSQMLPLEQAVQHFLLARTVSSLYQCYIRLSGEAVEDYAHIKDMERLEIYRKKIQKVESQKWFKEHKRSLEVNVSAANRFISHAIPELTTEQRAALRQARKTGKRLKDSHQKEPTSRSSTEVAAEFLESMQTFEQAEMPAAGDTGIDAAQPAVCKTPPGVRKRKKSRRGREQMRK